MALAGGGAEELGSSWERGARSEERGGTELGAES